MEQYSPAQAAEHAKKWCANNPGWQRICDISDAEALYKKWDELTKKEQKAWCNDESYWKEFARMEPKVAVGFISGAGDFYHDVLEIPRFHNGMMIFKTGVTA